jgi:DNA-binding HxlR family transcriptional regulator
MYSGFLLIRLDQTVAMTARTYGQACSVANFLDLLGGRWTLLIVRDLLVGPRRFKALLAGLPGIGANLLSDRLRDLQARSVIRKTSSRQGRAAVYELTEKGLQLEPVVLAMARWGMSYLQGESLNKPSRPDLLVVAFRAAFRPEYAKNIRETYEFRIGETIFFARVEDGKLRTGLGTSHRPAMIFITDVETFDRIISGATDTTTERQSGTLKIAGDDEAFARCQRMFGYQPMVGEPI